MKYIKVDIYQKKNMIEIKNDGKGTPIEIHKI